MMSIGTYLFEQGLHEVHAEAIVVGDPDPLNNAYSAIAAIDTFWESFEGSVFPPDGWSMYFGVRDNINFGNSAHGEFFYSSFVDSNFFGVVAFFVEGSAAGP